MPAGISLANKSQLLFGFSVVVILGAALAVPWIWTQSLVADAQREHMRELVAGWEAGEIAHGDGVDTAGEVPLPYGTVFSNEPMRMNFVRLADLDRMGIENEFLLRAREFFQENPEAAEFFIEEEIDGEEVSHYARAIRESDVERIRAAQRGAAPPQARDTAAADPIVGMLVIDRRSEFASSRLLVTTMYIVAAWLSGSLLAILVFYFILKKHILSPVRTLRETAEKIEAGEITIRANIRTGDEFEQLSSAFNSMLERFTESQRQLRNMNETLDLRLSELAEANYALFESNRLKGEFLASVSHELKTPLNLIIGFGELLEEIVRSEPDPNPKRLRYIENILTSARSLLEMISDLLEMAKIEAGRVELSIEPTNVRDLVEGMQKLVQPEADRRGIELVIDPAPNLPTIETDAGKLQQILYNYLSNALKFTPKGGMVTLRAERITERAQTRGVRLSVTDTGPGVPDDMQDMIFEKFRQVDASHTREHQGVGLGLAICRELATLLGGEVGLESHAGRGASFIVELPLRYEPPKPPPLLADVGNGVVAAQRP